MTVPLLSSQVFSRLLGWSRFVTCCVKTCACTHLLASGGGTRRLVGRSSLVQPWTVNIELNPQTSCVELPWRRMALTCGNTRATLSGSGSCMQRTTLTSRSCSQSRTISWRFKQNQNKGSNNLSQNAVNHYRCACCSHTLSDRRNSRPVGSGALRIRGRIHCRVVRPEAELTAWAAHRPFFGLAQA